MNESKTEIQEKMNLNCLIENRFINKKNICVSIYFYFDCLRHFMMQNCYI